MLRAPLSMYVAAIAMLSSSSLRAPRAEVRPTAPMHIVRMAHTATTLGDGRVLIAGGFTETSNAAVSAELYDAKTSRFSPLPPMRTPRHSHTATVLRDGKVLIVGGYGPGTSALATAELFDPATNTFTYTGALTTPRAGHVAVLLRDGTVLVAGGVGANWTFLASAERFDPKTGRFTATGSMADARESHAAVRLADGRVLIAGGHRDRRPNITLFASAELYDPTTGVFSRTGDMTVRRHKHDAVLLADGRVLVSGGADERDSGGQYRSTELFNPTSGTFSVAPMLTRSRYKHNGSSVLLPNGNVLLAGGASGAEMYDARRHVFTSVAGTDSMSGYFSAVALMPTGDVLITGGYGHNIAPQALAWIYKP